MRGYRKQHELSCSALRRLPIVGRLEDLILCAKLYWSLGDGPRRREPEWTTALRERLRATLSIKRQQFEQEPIRAIYVKRNTEMETWR